MRGSSWKAMLFFVCLEAIFLIIHKALALEEEVYRRPGILQIGSHEPILISSNAYSEISPTVTRHGDKISKQYSFYHPGASYISVHFQHMNLGEGCSMTVQAASTGDMSHVYTGQGRNDLGTFWAHHIYGDSIEIILACDDWETNKAEFEVDEYAAGFPDAQLRDMEKRRLRGEANHAVPPPLLGRDGRELSICGTNDMRNAQCYKDSFQTEYSRSGAVAKVVIHGTGVCTGWLVGPNNIFVTNQHCIQTEQQALTSDYIFDFEADGGGDCNKANRKDRSISESTYDASELVAISNVDDYVLIKLAGNPVDQHGFLELDPRKPSVGEKIYIPQHPGGLDKEIAIYDTHLGEGERCEIQTVHGESCFGGFTTGYWDLSYSCDTKGGTSGSPVLSVETHKVIGLHHCGGGCSIGNVAVPIVEIYNDIKDLLGPPATPNPTPPPTTPYPTPPPTARPTPHPTSQPTPEPTPNPTPRSTPFPTPNPTPSPTPNPTPYPTPLPSPSPTPRPSSFPTMEHSSHPTVDRSANPTADPTPIPTPGPTPSPTTRNPTPPPTPNPTPNPTPGPTPFLIAKPEFEPCPLDFHRFKLDLQTDNNGHETYWTMKDGHSQVYMQVSAYTYEDNTFYQLSVCIPSDRYKFTIRDTAEDGISGEHGDGYFQIHVDGVLRISGGVFGKKDQYTLLVPS